MVKLFQLEVFIIYKSCLSFNSCVFCARAVHITDNTSINAQSQISKTVGVLVHSNIHNHRKGCERCQQHLDWFETLTETEFSVHFSFHFYSGIFLVAYNTKAGMAALEGFTSPLIFITCWQCIDHVIWAKLTKITRKTTSWYNRITTRNIIIINEMRSDEGAVGIESVKCGLLLDLDPEHLTCLSQRAFIDIWTGFSHEMEECFSCTAPP